MGITQRWLTCFEALPVSYTHLDVYKRQGLHLAPPELRYATGYGVAAAALPLLRTGKTCSPQDLDAFYLRRPQAERERLKRLSESKAN